MPFQCVVREIVQDITGGPWNTRKGIPYSIFSFRDATLLPVIQEAAEAYLVELFEDTNIKKDFFLESISDGEAKKSKNNGQEI